jgi:hypothetical protein
MDMYLDGQHISQNILNVKKYTPIIDEPAQTLKVK